MLCFGGCVHGKAPCTKAAKKLCCRVHAKEAFKTCGGSALTLEV